MSRLVSVLLIVALLVGPTSHARAATPYTGPQRIYSTSDVLSILGKNAQRRPSDMQNLNLLEFNADLSTRVKCGQVDLINNPMQTLTNLYNQVKKVPNELVSLLPTALAAAPMLTLCAASPTMCAEVKNFNFQIHEKLKLLANQCQAIDSYINSQAAAGGMMSLAEKQAWQKCVNQWTSAGNDISDAMVACNNSNNPPLMTDIAKAWLGDTTTTAPQRVFQSLLEASGQWTQAGLGETRYRAITALLGEMKLDVNGKLLPLFPEPPLTGAMLAKRAVTFSTGLACDPVALLAAVNGTIPSTNADLADRYAEQAQLDVVKESLEVADVDNLFMLDPPDINVACSSLGRTIAKEGITRIADETETALATALQSPTVPKEIQEQAMNRIKFTLPTLKSQRIAPQVLTFAEWRSTVGRMALTVRQERRLEAAQRSGDVLNEEETFTTECYDEDSCN